MRRCVEFLCLFRQVLENCSSLDLIWATADTIAAGGKLTMWASSHWMNSMKLTVSSDDDLLLNVYTQEARDSDTYKSAASSINTVCVKLSSPVKVLGLCSCHWPCLKPQLLPCFFWPILLFELSFDPWSMASRCLAEPFALVQEVSTCCSFEMFWME